MHLAEFTEDIRDGIQEVANIAVGQAAERMASSFSAFVRMPIPQVRLVEASDILMALSSVEQGAQVTAVTQAFVGDGVSGEALLLFTDASLDELSRLMDCEDSASEHQQLELVLEMASLLNGSCVTGILSQLDLNVMLKHPTVFGRHTMLSDMLEGRKFPWHQALAVEINYGFEGFNVNCDLLLLFHESSLGPLFDQIRLLLE